MMPKKDYYTNTVEDAAEFEAYFNSFPPDYDYDGPDSYYDDWDEEDPDYDTCQCSDPCCPCSGSKIGVP